MRWCEACDRPRPMAGAVCAGCGRAPDGTGGPAWSRGTPTQGTGTVATAAAAPPAALPLGVGPAPAPPWGPPPPSRRRRGPRGVGRALRILLSIAVAVAAGLVVRGPVWDAVDDRLDLTIADTADVDEPDERVVVRGGGLEWTMQEEPEADVQAVPVPGGSLTMRTWTTDIRRAGEAVAVMEVGDRPFDLDAGLRSAAAGMDGGELGPISSIEVDGRPARSVSFTAVPRRGAQVGRIVAVDAGAIVVVVLMGGDEDDEDAIAEQHEILLESLRFG